jgi:hypothetical protein
MGRFSFCPNPRCQWHMKAPSGSWYRPVGHHATLAFGLVPRFQCLSCRKTFSSQTFSIDYWAKKKVDYRRLLVANASSESGRAIARSMDLSCGTVINRLGRLSRQAAVLHAELLVHLRPRPVARDPSPLGEDDRGAAAEGEGALRRGWPRSSSRTRRRNTSESSSPIPLFRERDEEHRAVHVRLSSRLPRAVVRRPAFRATPQAGWRGFCAISSNTITTRNIS